MNFRTLYFSSIFFIIAIFSNYGNNSVAQTINYPCDTARPFCSDSSYVFPNSTSGTAPLGPNYGCLGSTPNPVWYYMQIGTAGTLQLTMSQTSASGTGLDVDFAMWGPYTSLSTGCLDVMSGLTPPLQCSYSSAATETIGLGMAGGFGTGASTPPSASVGEVYIVLITNYSGQPGTISFAQTGGTGSADCGIVCGLHITGDTVACSGSYFHFMAKNENDTDFTYNYLWTGPFGLTSTSQNPTFSINQPGYYNFDLLSISNINDTCVQTVGIHILGKDTTIINADICNGETYHFLGRDFKNPGFFDTTFINQFGCDSLVRLNLTVNPLPIVELSDTNATQYFCKGALGQLSIAQPSTSYHYQWKVNGSNVPGGTNAALNTTHSGDYQLFVTTLKGCTDSSKIITFNKDSVQMDFSPIPLLGCGSDTVKIINNSEPGSMYKWDFGDGSYPLDTTKTPTHVYNHQGTYYIHLLMADSLGCVDSLTKFVDLNHPLNADFTVSVDSLCQGEAAQVQFTNTSTGAQHYEWHFADGSPIATHKNPGHNFTLAGSHNVMLIASDSIPCYDTAYHIIYVDSLPFLYVIPDKTNLCIGEKLNLRLNYLSETATAVNWGFGDGIHWQQSDSAAHSFDKAGNYIVTVTVNHPVCPPSEDTVSISVHDLPIVNFGADTVLCLQGSPILIQNLATNAPGTQYRWNTGDSTATLSVVHPGYYALTASLSNCSTTEGITINKDCYVDVPNAFTPNGDGQNDYFFPRQYLSKGVTSFTLSIFNRWGQKVFETTKTDGRGWDGKFNGKEQPNGVYVYQMEVIYTNGRSEKYSGNVTLIR